MLAGNTVGVQVPLSAPDKIQNFDILMAITLDLNSETQAELVALAYKSGLSLEDYLLAIIGSNVFLRPSKPLSSEERASVWRLTAKRFPDAPLLSDEAISRESMYADRG